MKLYKVIHRRKPNIDVKKSKTKNLKGKHNQPNKQTCFQEYVSLKYSLGILQ